jgi:CRP-like cAMP-binding protein
MGQAAPKKSRVEMKDASGIPIIKGPLVDYLYIVDEDEFSDGQEIVVQSKYGNWLWVILEGTVAVKRMLPEGPVTITKLTDGAFIGGIGSLKEKTNIRSATVCAVGNVQLGVMDFHRIMEEFSKISQNLMQVLFSIEKRLTQVTTVCANAHLKKIKLHETMEDMHAFSFSEHPEDKIFKIVSGKAVVTKQINNHSIELCQLIPGDIIGNIPFLSTSHEPHSAMVFVSGPFQVDAIDLIDLKEEYDELSQTFKNIVIHTSTCLSVTTGRLMDMMKKPGSK